MDLTEKELEDRLREMGKRLASPPSNVQELLRLLDQTEIYLSRVEQSPSASMTDALRPLMSLLVTKELLKHPEEDVKVFVTACINEITRITAPDAPYDDDLMKEVFAMIVDAFGKLDNMSGFSYSKSVCILEIVAKVRSCVVMLDLECDDLILQMFKYFMKSIRQDHSVNVFSSMETIMTLVLEESEEIPQELLICLLSNLQLSKKDVMPVAHRLAEKVVSNCAMKLNPCLFTAVQSMGSSLSDYSGIVASIIQESSKAPEVDDSKSPEKTSSDEFPQESEKLGKCGSCLEEVASFSDNARKTISNGVIPARNCSPFAESNSPEFKHEHSFSSVQFKNDTETKGENDNVNSVDQKHGLELTLRHTEGKSALGQLADVSDSSRVDGDKEAFAPTVKREVRRKENQGLKSGDASNIAPQTEQSVGGGIKKIDDLVGANEFEKSEAPSEKTPSGHRPKRGRTRSSQSSPKKGLEDKPASRVGKKRMSGNLMIHNKGSQTKDSDLDGGNDSVSNSDGKLLQDSAKKSLDHSASFEAAVATKDSRTSGLDEKADARMAAEADISGKQGKYNIKQSKHRDVIEKHASIDNNANDMDVLEEPCLKEMIASSKASRAANNDNKHLGEDPQMSLSKKLLQGKDVLSKAQHSKSKLNEDICGSMIKVWWPVDKQFYSGVIESFDPKTRKHKIVYDDGDVEILLLKKECWDYIKRCSNANNQEKVGVKESASPESSLHFNSRAKARFKRRRRLRQSGRWPFGDRAAGRTSNEVTAKGECDEGTRVEDSPTNHSDESPGDTTTVELTTTTRAKPVLKLNGKRTSQPGDDIPADGSKGSLEIDRRISSPSDEREKTSSSKDGGAVVESSSDDETDDAKFKEKSTQQRGDGMLIFRSKGGPKLHSWRMFSPSHGGAAKASPMDGEAAVVESSEESDDETPKANLKGKKASQPGGGQLVFKSKGRPRIGSWRVVGLSDQREKTLPKDAGAAGEASGTNDSGGDPHDANADCKVKSDVKFKGRRSLPPGDDGMSGPRSRGRPKADDAWRMSGPSSEGAKVSPKNAGAAVESSQTIDDGDDACDADTCTRVEVEPVQGFEEKKNLQSGDGLCRAMGTKPLPNEGGKSVSKPRGRRRGPTSKNSIPPPAEVLKSPSKDEATKVESSHANCSGGSKDASSDEKLGREDELKMVDDPKAGGKRKAIAAAIDGGTDAAARKKRGDGSFVKNADAAESQRAPMKGKRRRRK